MTRVPVDRTENDPQIFRDTLRDFERPALTVTGTWVAAEPEGSTNHLRPRDSHGRFTKKESDDG